MLEIRSARAGPPPLPPLLAMSAGVRPDPVFRLARGLAPGCGLILRHYRMDAGGRAKLAHDLAAVCRAGGIRLLIGGDPKLAGAVGAQGVHYPEGLLRRAGRLRRGAVRPGWVRPGWLITAAAHSSAAARRAEQAGADAVLLSPIFPTPSHPGAAGLGLMQLAHICHRARLPVYALGGIRTPAQARACLHAGAAGLAGRRMFL